MFKFRNNSSDASVLLLSQLYDQDTFYPAFLADMARCKHELIIESPFITSKRIAKLLPLLKKLRARNIKITINTRNPEEHDGIYELQAENAVASLQELGVIVLYTGGHHRKLAIVDRHVMWEGSLNILSHYDSCEIMRRTTSQVLTQQMINFLNLEQYLI